MYSKWDRIISALVTWIKNISRVSEAKRGRYELIQVTCAEIILSHFESIWWYFSHTFHYLTDEISWKYEKTCQSGTWMLVHPICVRLTFSPRTFTRITLAMCAHVLRFQRRWRSWVRLSSLTYVRQWGGYHIHDQGEMCFERSTVSHDFSVKRCGNMA